MWPYSPRTIVANTRHQPTNGRSSRWFGVRWLSGTIAVTYQFHASSPATAGPASSTAGPAAASRRCWTSTQTTATAANAR